MMDTPLFPEAPSVLTISQFTQQVKTLLEEGFSSVWVAGEISNLSRPTSGHLYFSLKDSGAQVGAVIWRGTAARLRFALQDGLEVIARGKVSVYAPRGNYQIIIEELQPKGMGALELALKQLKEKLEKLGFFEAERKKPLPAYPRRLALVTSASGAAVRDMVQVLTSRWPLVEICLYPVRVQGDGASAEIARAIENLNAWHAQGLLPVDVMIVGRGGGSIEDLWAFNEEIVARAIFASRIPIVSAVGHETDWTIADGVADLRALTPTEAATRTVPNWQDIWRELVDRQNRLRDALLTGLRLAKQRLVDLAQRKIFRLPLERIRLLEREVDDKNGRLTRSVRQRLVRFHDRLGSMAAHLHSLSPLNVLARGYSLTRKETTQALVREANQVQMGERLITLLRHGEIVSRVEECLPATPGPAGRPAT